MSKVLTGEECMCNSVQWHKMIRSDLVWCARCGSIRTVFKSHWQVPLLSVPEEVPPTDPGKKKP